VPLPVSIIASGADYTAGWRDCQTAWRGASSTNATAESNTRS
jgi:hypothetical protein